ESVCPVVRRGEAGILRRLGAGSDRARPPSAGQTVITSLRRALAPDRPREGLTDDDRDNSRWTDLDRPARCAAGRLFREKPIGRPPSQEATDHGSREIWLLLRNAGSKVAYSYYPLLPLSSKLIIQHDF